MFPIRYVKYISQNFSVVMLDPDTMQENCVFDKSPGKWLKKKYMIYDNVTII